MRGDGSGSNPFISDRAPLPRCACLLARSASPIRAQIVFIKKAHFHGEIETKIYRKNYQSGIDIVADIQRLAGGK